MHMNNHQGAGATEKKTRDLNINTRGVVKGLSDHRQCIAIIHVIVTMLQTKYQYESQKALCSPSV